MSLIDTAIRPLEADELDRWIVSLEADEHDQNKGSLRTAVPNDDSGRYGYCCLGLKCHVDGLDLDSSESVGPDDDGNDVLDFLYQHSGVTVGTEETPAPLHGLSYSTRNSLANANDSTAFPHTFPMIAAVLRKHREALLEGHNLHFDVYSGEWRVVAP